MKPKEIKTQDVFNQSIITVKINHTNVTRVRVWIGSKLIKAGINIIGCEDNIIMKRKGGDSDSKNQTKCFNRQHGEGYGSTIYNNKD